ncbi:hypothetical protein EV175_002082 [Coemansia sp. RSA 1933]|nr:hypothetical protein EV175_002082 [Coemansia sp. RSA 1933]
MSDATVPYEKDGYTLYSNARCPFAQRALRAFKASGVAHKVVEIDLQNKPSWYGKVNPQLKVPALRTPDGTILIESLVIAEFVADKFPEANLLPSDATERAQLRLFIELFGSRFNSFIYSTLRASTAEDRKEQAEKLLSGAREASEELEKQWERPSGKGGPFWSNGKFAYAEIVLASFINMLVVLRHYRGLEIPDTREYQAFNRWRKALINDPLFIEVNPDVDGLIEVYKKFAA